MITRRSVLIGSAATLIAPPLLAAQESMPTLFYGHGGPWLAKDRVRGRELLAMAQQLPRSPSGIVAFTPHVRARQITLASTGIARWSFPRRFRKSVGGIRYHPPRAEELAGQVYATLKDTKFAYSTDEHNGFNHTIWMGLLHLFPGADIPVVEVAMPFESSARLFELGQALAPLRANGTLIVSSGTVTHNLGTFGHFEKPPSWASDYDTWTADAIARNDIDSLIDWRKKAPGSNIAHPDDSAHFNVMMFALGAAVGRGGGLSWSRTMHEGFGSSAFSERGFLFA